MHGIAQCDSPVWTCLGSRHERTPRVLSALSRRNRNHHHQRAHPIDVSGWRATEAFPGALYTHITIGKDLSDCKDRINVYISTRKHQIHSTHHATRAVLCLLLSPGVCAQPARPAQRVRSVMRLLSPEKQAHMLQHRRPQRRKRETPEHHHNQRARTVTPTHLFTAPSK